MDNFDLVIVSHEKDFNNIKFIVEFCEKNIGFESVHLILSERETYKDEYILRQKTNKMIYIHKESDVLKIEKNRLRHRPDWIYQMFLKMFQNVTLNDNFLIIEADCLILNKIEFFENQKTIFFLGRNQNWEPYFKFNNLFGFGRDFDHSFISEFMMYDKKIIREMLQKFKCDTVNDFLEICYDKIDGSCYPADYEFYGNYCMKYHKENFTTKPLNWSLYGRDKTESPKWSDDEIKNLINSNCDKDVISFHTWGFND